MGAAERFEADSLEIGGEWFAAMCRRRPQDFTRRRKMGCADLVGPIVGRKGRTLKIELRELRKERGMPEISAPGYLKAREKLDPAAIAWLATRHAARLYDDGDFRTLGGFVALAVDGSTAAVPTCPETLAAYGNASTSGRDQAMCGLSCLYDVANRQILDLEVTRLGFDERSVVPGHAAAARALLGATPFLLVLDRGYPSAELMASLDDAGVSYLMRCPSSFLDEEFRACAGAGGDAELRVRLTAKRLSKSRRLGPDARDALLARGLWARFALVDAGGAEPERLVTNVPAARLAHGDLAGVYRARWGVETCFQMLKDRLQMENFTGTKPVLVEQDVFACAYLLNVAFDLANEADAGLRDGGSAHRMTVNRSYALGVAKAEVVRAMLAPPGESAGIMRGVLEELRGCLVPVRPDRSHGRAGLGKPRANRYSNTHKRVF